MKNVFRVFCEIVLYVKNDIKRKYIEMVSGKVLYWKVKAFETLGVGLL